MRPLPLPETPSVKNVFPSSVTRDNVPGFCPRHTERFRQLYQERYGLWLCEAQAQRLLRALVALVRYQQGGRLEQNQIDLKHRDTRHLNDRHLD